MEELPKSNEKRASERIPLSFLIHGSRHGSENLSEESITGVVRDISGAGLSFLSDAEYTVGDTLDLELDLPGSQHQFMAQVVRTEPFGDSKIVGVSFAHLSSEHRKALVEALLAQK